MQSIPGFVKFMKNHGLDQSSIQYSACFIQHKRIHKGQYVFKQGDASKHFYGIISGVISIRLNKLVESTKKLEKSNKYVDSVVKDNKFYLIYEEELVRFTAGCCFGQWGLIDNKPRSTGAVAAEDTDLFLINKENFEFAFKKPLKRAELERRAFIASTLKLAHMKNTSVFENFFKNTVAKTPDKRALIYSAGSPVTSIFLIYKGEFELLHHVKSMLLPKILVKVGKGSILGLEAFSDNKTYKYSLRCSSEEAVLIEIPKVKLDMIIDQNQGFLRQKSREADKIYSKLLKNIKTERERVKKQVENRKFEVNSGKSRNIKVKVRSNARTQSFNYFLTDTRDLPKIEKKPEITHKRVKTDRYLQVAKELKLSPAPRKLKKRLKVVSPQILETIAEFKKERFNTGMFSFPLVTNLLSE